MQQVWRSRRGFDEDDRVAIGREHGGAEPRVCRGRELESVGKRGATIVAGPPPHERRDPERRSRDYPRQHS